MLRRIIPLFIFLSASALVQAEPAPGAKVFGHRDANGRMVFTDQEQGGGKEVQVSKPSVIQDSKLGVKAYSRQTQKGYERAVADETAARRRNEQQYADAQDDADRMRSYCEGLREIISHSQYGSSTYRLRKQDEYDRQCIKNGY
ncbi:MAG: hypothetical protein REI12_01575 [Pedobacter sp.]|nr:hypothetical protein [Pedobacter sp.]